MIIFSDNSVTTTLQLIDNYAFPEPFNKYSLGLILPLISALIYVFVYPYPAKFISDFTLRRQREQNESKMKIAGETLLSQEKSDQIYILMRRRENEHRERIKQYENENQALLDELERLKSGIRSETPVLEEDISAELITDPELNMLNDDHRVLYCIAAHDDSVDRDFLRAVTQFENIKVEWILDKLKQKNYIVWIKGGPGGGHVELTREGRDYVMKNDLINLFGELT